MTTKCAKALKINWIIWSLLTLLVLVGMFALYLFSTPRIPLKLTVGETAQTNIIRSAPQKLRIDIVHANNGREKTELGEWRRNSDIKTSKNEIDFDNPGPEVKIRVQTEKQSQLYEAMPANGYTQRTYFRELIPYSADNDPHRFAWDAHHLRTIELPSWQKTTLHFSVEAVAPELNGEEVQIYIYSPVGIKVTSRGYGFWFFFLFWQFYLIILAAYLLILLFFSRHHIRIFLQKTRS